MANYNKSFNFKNGLQVDNGNFVVNPSGSVGIGTSAPNELLDVRGNIKVSGFVTASNIFTTNIYISGTPSYNSLNIGNIFITSGVVTATTGIVTYYGDGSKLSNIPSSYWTLSGSTIYSTRNIGVNTTNPAFSLQIGPNPLLFPTGIGINSSGNVYSNGIVTATSFSGSGQNLTSLNASNIVSGSLLASLLPSNINLTGIITAASFSGSGEELTSLNASNITSGTISTAYFPPNIGISGTVTAAKFVGNLTGTATTAENLSSTGSLNLGSVNSGFASIGVATVTNALYVVGFPAKIGVGTNATPQSDIEVNKTGISSIRVLSNNNIALIGIGRSAEIRTGNTDTYYSYSTRDALDILNYNSGNVNAYLDYGVAGVNTGNFNWIHGQIPFAPLMTLTYDGKLGLGITNPSTKLYVVGPSYFTGITTIDSNLNVSNDLRVSGDTYITGILTANRIFSAVYGEFTGGTISGTDIAGTSLSISGISTLGGVRISSGIITSATVGLITYYGDGSKLSNITVSGTISISTNTTNQNQYVPYATSFSSVTSLGATNNFVFNPSSGNLGIGITNPTSKLYVNGDTYITGVLTANRIVSSTYGEFTGGTISGTNVVGTSLSVSGISTLGRVQISSGIVTATSGVVTYYGDGSKLSGVTVSYATTAGISTVAQGLTGAPSIAVTSLNVTGISTFGTVKISSGIITATAGVVTYYGDGSKLNGVTVSYANTAGIATVAQGLSGTPSIAVTSLSVTGISTLGGVQISSGIIASSTAGVVTYYGDGSKLSGVTVSYATTAGIATVAQGLTGAPSIAITSLSVTGISTLGSVRISSGIITATAGVVTYYGDGSKLSGVTVSYANTAGIATVAQGLSGTPSIAVSSLSASGISTLGSVRISSGIITATAGVVTYYGDGSKLSGIVVSGAISISTNTSNQNQYVPYVTSFGSTTGLGATNNFVFNPTSGNLGINTSNPTSKLYVNGDTYITGILTANRIVSSTYGEFTGGTISGTNVVGTSLSISGISTLGSVRISSGIITATAGVVTYYGDGSKLSGVTVSYANTAGIATVAQGLTGTPNISVGIATASSFVGNLVGIASTATNLSNAANITTGTINSARLSGSYGINVSYATTAGIATIAQGLTGTPNIAVTSLSASGISTISGIQISSGIIASATAGVVTYYGDGSKLSGVTVSYANTAGIATVAQGLTGVPSIAVTSLNVTGISTLGSVRISSGIITATAGVVTYYGDGSKLNNINVSYANTAGIATVAQGLTGTPGIAVTSLSVTGISTLGTVRISSGIITATSGVVTYYGDGSKLSGVTVSYANTAGIATVAQGLTGAPSIAVTSLNVTGISTLGSVRITSGIITATSGVVTYYGDGSKLSGVTVSYANTAGIATVAQGLTGVPSIAVTSLNVTGISTLGTVRISSGIITATSGVVTYYGDGSKLSSVNASYATTAGIATVAKGLTGVPSIAVTSLNVTGISTLGGVQISSGIIASATVGLITYYGDGSKLSGVTVSYANTAGIATVAQGLTGAPSIAVTSLSVTGISTFGTVKISSGIITSATAGVVTYYGDGSKLSGTGSLYTPEYTGAVQRQVKNKLSESGIISINDFGGNGNGVFNNITAFNLAGSASTAFNISTTTSIGIVQIPSGNYFIGTTNIRSLVSGTGQISIAGTSRTATVGGFNVGFDVIGGSIISTPDIWAQTANDLNKTPGVDSASNYYNVILAPGCNVNSGNTGKNIISRSVLVGNSVGTAISAWERVEAIGNGALRFAPLADRITAVGSIVYQWLGAPNEQYLIDTLHDFWKNSEIRFTPPGDPNWDAFNLEERNSGIGTWIKNFVGYATDKGQCAANVAIGRDAALHTVIDEESVYVGYRSGTHTFAVLNNTAVGSRSLNDGVKVSGCTALGKSAGMWNQDGTNNVFVGHQAGRKLVTGSNNVFIGAFSGQVFDDLTDNVGNGVTDKGYNVSNRFVVQSGDSDVVPPPLLSGNFNTGFLGVSGITTAETSLHVGKTVVTGRTWSPTTSVVGMFENNTNSVISIVAANNSFSGIDFSDATSQFMGRIQYSHVNNSMSFTTNDSGVALTLGSNGSVQFNRISTTSSSANAFLDGNKSILVSTSSSIYKKDIETLESWRADEFIEKARPVWYRSKASADNPDWGWYGLIAEEVAEIDPRLVQWSYQDDQYEEVVKVNEDGSEEKELKLKEGSQKRPNGIQYDRLGVMLLDVVKRQKQTINDLEKRLAALEAHLTGS